MLIERFRSYTPTAAFALLIFYFAVCALTGERGLLTDRRRDTTLAARIGEVQALRVQRTELESRVRLLDDQNLSRDLLEERARRVLGFFDPQDYVIRIRR